MSQNDYIILRDENGTPYIAHAGWLDNAKNTMNKAVSGISNAAQQVANKAKGVGRGVRQNHKYILKVFENGRTRYFYKQEEVKAYYEAKKRGIKNAAEYAQNAVKDKASDVVNAAKNVVDKATGATVKQQHEQATKEYNDAKRWEALTKRTHQENMDAFKKNPTEANLKRAKQSGQAVTQAKLNTKESSGKELRANAAETMHPVNEAKRAFSKAKDAANNTVSNAKNAYERMKGEFRDRAEQAGNAAKSVASKTVDKAKAMYQETPLGKLESFAANPRTTVKESVQGMIDQAKKTAKNTVASAQEAFDYATGNNYRKRAQEANQAAENAINQRARTNDQLENQRSKYGSKANDSDHIYGDSEGYYYKTKEQRDRAEALISKRDQYDADIVNNNRASKVNDHMYANSKAGKINDILGRSNVSTSERANSKATEVRNKWDRQEAESKLIGGRLDPNINVSKEYVYSRASNSGMAGQVRQVMQLEEAMRNAESAYDRLGEDSSKPQSSSRAARQKMLQAQNAYEKAYEELIDDINKQYDRDLAAYEKQYGKYNRG